MIRPEVSIVMSVYNGDRYLKEAVESILNQTFSDFEFIIVDDASTDKTWEILRSYAGIDSRIVLLRNQENSGISRSLNRGLVATKGLYIARQDADDISMPERIEVQVSFLRDNREVGIIGSAYCILNPQGECKAIFKQPSTDSEIRWQILFHNPFCHSSVMFRRELLKGLHMYYRDDLKYSQDYELWTRLLMLTKGANLQSPLVAFRIHEKSSSVIHRSEQHNIATRISSEMIKRIAPEISISFSEVERLREWYYQLPERWGMDDFRLAILYLKIMNAFKINSNIDRKMGRIIQKKWIDIILQKIPLRQFGDVLRSGLLWAFIRSDLLSVFSHIPKRTARGLRDLIERRN
jgi:glycosyltransferase involved in cell wall biosynthesis